MIKNYTLPPFFLFFCGLLWANTSLSNSKNDNVIPLPPPGITVNIQSNKKATVWFTDFYSFGDTSCVFDNSYEYSLRRSGTGTGFPLDSAGNLIRSLTYTCADLGNQYVEIWYKDTLGNVDFCEKYVIVSDYFQYCIVSDPFLTGSVKTENGDGIEEANIEFLAVTSNGLPYINSQLTNNNGEFNFNTVPLPLNTNLAFTPSKDNNHLNGVSTYDL